MRRQESVSKRPSFITWMLLGIPIVFIIAAPLHFLYDWSGQIKLIAPFVPVSESPWEHLKLIFWPLLIWWLVGYLTLGKKERFPFPRAAVICVISEVVSLMMILFIFYTYTGALGIESLVVDIASMLVALLIAIPLSIHVGNKTSPGGFSGLIAILIVAALASAFVYFTFHAPHLPLFLDKNSGTYGIM